MLEKINKPASRFIEQIYLLIYSVCKNTDEVIADIKHMARYLFGQISSELLFFHPQLQVLYTRNDQGILQLRHLSHPATQREPKTLGFPPICNTVECTRQSTKIKTANANKKHYKVMRQCPHNTSFEQLQEKEI